MAAYYPPIISKTTPPFGQGGFTYTTATAIATPTYPSDGKGTGSTTAGDAIWTQNGHASGTFEVLVEKVIAAPNANTSAVIGLACLATAKVFYFPPGSHTVNMAFPNGFTFVSSLIGGTVVFRIQEHAF